MKLPLRLGLRRDLEHFGALRFDFDGGRGDEFDSDGGKVGLDIHLLAGDRTGLGPGVVDDGGLVHAEVEARDARLDDALLLRGPKYVSTATWKSAKKKESAAYDPTASGHDLVDLLVAILVRLTLGRLRLVFFAPELPRELTSKALADRPRQRAVGSIGGGSAPASIKEEETLATRAPQLVEVEPQPVDGLLQQKLQWQNHISVSSFPAIMKEFQTHVLLLLVVKRVLRAPSDPEVLLELADRALKQLAVPLKLVNLGVVLLCRLLHRAILLKKKKQKSTQPISPPSKKKKKRAAKAHPPRLGDEVPQLLGLGALVLEVALEVLVRVAVLVRLEVELGDVALELRDRLEVSPLGGLELLLLATFRLELHAGLWEGEKKEVNRWRRK